MYRPLLNMAFLVCLLVVSLMTQLATNAVARGGGGTMTGLAQMAAAGDGLLADLVRSVCTQDRGGTVPAESQDCLCQMCLPVVYQMAYVGSLSGGPAPGGADTALPRPESQILPASRRLLGDGPSRAPPPAV
jgi:hypothetical protein